MQVSPGTNRALKFRFNHERGAVIELVLISVGLIVVALVFMLSVVWPLLSAREQLVSALAANANMAKVVPAFVNPDGTLDLTIMGAYANGAKGNLNSSDLPYGISLVVGICHGPVCPDNEFFEYNTEVGGLKSPVNPRLQAMIREAVVDVPSGQSAIGAMTVQEISGGPPVSAADERMAAVRMPIPIVPQPPISYRFTATPRERTTSVPSATADPSVSPTVIPTPTSIPTDTAEATATPTIAPTDTVERTPTAVPTDTALRTPTVTPEATATVQITPTPPLPSPSVSPAITATAPAPTLTAAPSVSVGISPTTVPSPSRASSPTAVVTATARMTASVAPTSVPTAMPTFTAPLLTPTRSPFPSLSATRSPVATVQPTRTTAPSLTALPNRTPTPIATTVISVAVPPPLPPPGPTI